MLSPPGGGRAGKGGRGGCRAVVRPVIRWRTDRLPHQPTTPSHAPLEARGTLVWCEIDYLSRERAAPPRSRSAPLAVGRSVGRSTFCQSCGDISPLVVELGMGRARVLPDCGHARLTFLVSHPDPFPNEALFEASDDMRVVPSHNSLVGR